MGLLAGVGAAAIVAVLTVAALVVLLRNQETAASTLLADTVASADDVVDPPSGMWLAIRTGTTTAVSPGLPPGLPVLDALEKVGRTGGVDLRDVVLDGTRYRVRTQASHGVVVQAGLDLASDRVQSVSMLRALLLIGGLGLLLAALAGAWVGRRAVRPLAATLALQRRFVADASHELRTPITLLSTRAQLIRRSVRGHVVPGALAGEIDGLVDDSQQLTAILEDLLLAADGRDDPATLTDLTQLSQAVAESSASYARTRNIEVTAALGASAPVLGSPVALRRAITALVDNAIRHAGSTVRLDVLRTGNKFTVEVRDDGPGITADLAPHLFDRFASAPPSDTDGCRHYGLGLALVGEIAARHNGAITSIPSTDGATIHLILPAAPHNGSASSPG